MSEFYVTKNGAGVKNGSKWADAAEFSGSIALKNQIENLLPADDLYYGTPANTIEETLIDEIMIVNSRSGEVHKPIRILGAVVSNSTVSDELNKIGAPLPLFFSTANFPPKLGTTDGKIFLRLERDYYDVAGFNVCNMQSFITTRVRPVRGINVSNIQGANLRGVIANGSSDAVLHDSKFEQMVFKYVGYFGLFIGGSNLSFVDIHVDHGGLDYTTAIVGLKFGSSAGDMGVDGLLIKNSSFGNGYDVDGTIAYVQGDGILCEKATKNVEIESVECVNYGDAGFDIKSNDATLTSVYASNCKYGIKLWGTYNVEVRNAEVTACTNACLQVPGYAEVYDSKFTRAANNTAQVINLPANAVWGGLGGAVFYNCEFDTNGAPDKLVNFGEVGHVIEFINCIIDGVFYPRVRHVNIREGNVGIAEMLVSGG